ncbi:hypothetical protein D9756_001943 [Leucocoprinus leucothites]|uniref:Uncharacterized protein n=1 Tax=Leucocoprinus leucothites TaxID=201217 RepID=A0A8H5G565_9AGAR|nr:hypothetical protein D9756_001943 [Leucoagaricus leucothites]
MPGLLSPMPLLPPFEIVDRGAACRFVSPPPIYCPQKPSAMSLPPFKCPPMTSDPYAALPCSPSPRRRPSALCTQTLRHRRRHVSRVDYRSEPLQLHAFDKLPWIASLDVPPSNSTHPADIADLSQLPDPTLPQIRPSGSGPIRRRKPSPRSSPLLSPPSVFKSSARSNNNDDNNHLFHHLSCNSSARDTPPRPSTPTRKFDFDPTRVTFRHLMPVSDPFSDDDDV